MRTFLIAVLLFPVLGLAQAPAYNSLSIAWPESEGTVFSNTGEIELRVSLDPDLRADRGDAIAVILDGVPVRRTYQSTTLVIDPADWGGGPPEGVEYQTLQVTVVDGAGATLITSSPVRFYLRRHDGGRRR